MAKLPGNTLGSPSPALMEPTASPKAGGSSTSAPKQGCSLPVPAVLLPGLEWLVSWERAECQAGRKQ